MILTQFSVWPESGGLLDQDPLFLRRLQTYTVLKARADQKKQAAEERKNGRRKPRMRG